MQTTIRLHVLRNARNRRGWTQQHLADVADLSLRTVQRIESSGSCSPESLLALASALEIQCVDLVKEKGPRSSSCEPLLRRFRVATVSWTLGGVLAIALVFSFGVSARPVMLVVDLASGNTEVSSVQLLSEAGETSEVRTGILKMEFTAQVDDDSNIFIQVHLYSVNADGDMTLVAEPGLLVEDRKTAEVRFADSGGTPYQLRITPVL